MGTRITRQESSAATERIVSILISFVLAIVLLPVAAFVGGALWFEAAGNPAYGMLAALATGVLSLALVARLSGWPLRYALKILHRLLPEPFFSSLEFGLLGAFLGSLMLPVILVLGHQRPVGLELNGVLPAVAICFAACAVIGLLVGLRRRRRSAS